MREVFQLMSDEELQEISIRQRLDSGAITAATFSTLPSEEQARVLEVLFRAYAERVDTVRSLCGLEYLVFALAKLFFKHVPTSEQTQEEQDFTDRLKAIVDAHEVSTSGAVNEYLDYIETGAMIARQNRTEYRQKKEELIGM